MSRIKQIIPTACIIILLLTLTECASNPKAHSLRQTLQSIPAKNLSGYAFDPSVPVEKRIQKVPAALLQFIRDSDQNNSYSPYIPSQEDLVEVQKNLQLLPKAYLSILKDRLIGIYFVNNWVGSGAADYILDSNDTVYTILILNPEVLRHNISDWLTYREQTCYLSRNAKDSDISVKIDCGAEYTGLTYVLLHEASHIVDSTVKSSQPR